MELTLIIKPTKQCNMDNMLAIRYAEVNIPQECVECCILTAVLMDG